MVLDLVVPLIRELLNRPFRTAILTPREIYILLRVQENICQLSNFPLILVQILWSLAGVFHDLQFGIMAISLFTEDRVFPLFHSLCGFFVGLQRKQKEFLKMPYCHVDRKSVV